ncbi:DNA-binding protein HEXBP-like [Chenopodium quinoa]|uniref:DNA-binding protein HEXBP-like n=1 Tax=Chenopodium quinoa TaxID=63459 RepID=UPI000B785166|nr:DNA-binding protein HEXBP-like [Chenopodium quinoa]
MLEANFIFIERTNSLIFEDNIETADSGTLPQSIVDGFEPQQDLAQPEVSMDPTLPNPIQPNSKSGIIEENVVLRKLLRKRRYFDCRDGSSYIKAHAVNSPAQKLESPCYVCGQFQHTGKRCPKRRICSTCKKRGHIAVDCPVNDSECNICLRCGESGHELFSCNVEYSPDDLKNVQCYVCNELGHICCGNYSDISVATTSCYNCGISGHSGLQCPKPNLDKSGSCPPPICYKCGDGDHVARRCPKDVGLSACNKHRQASELDLELDVDGNLRTGRRSKTYRHSRVKKQKLKRLLEYMTV